MNMTCGTSDAINVKTMIAMITPMTCFLRLMKNEIIVFQTSLAISLALTDFDYFSGSATFKVVSSSL